MTIRELIKLMEQEGYTIEYKVRYEGLSKKQIKKKIKPYVGTSIETDKRIELSSIRYQRGIRINKINGVKYSGSKGNEILRKLYGVELSKRRASQLQSIRTPKLTPLPEELDFMLRKAQRLRRETIKKGGKDYGKIGKKRVRYILEEHGYEEARDLLTHHIRVNKGQVDLWLWKDFKERVARDYLEMKKLASVKRIYDLTQSANTEKITFQNWQDLQDHLYNLEYYYMKNERNLMAREIVEILKILRDLQ